jgi:two-component system CheB/CheR fusion protein
VLQPLEVDRQSTLHMPVDFFFRSLARDQKDRVIGIVLSGTGTDGSLGLQEIKAALGMVMVQEQASAQYDGMPRSAIATEQVDYVLPVSAMPGQLSPPCSSTTISASSASPSRPRRSSA